MARCGCNNALSTTCDAIMSCMAGALGMGLDYNEATRQIELRISGDAGNIADIGSDDGLFAPAGSVGPGPMTWLKTVATLPADVISAASGANLVGPATAPDMIEYLIANNVDTYSPPCYVLADGTVFESIGGPATLVTTYTDNPGTILNALTSSLNLQQMNYDAGTRVSPTSRNSNAPAALLTPDGGWGGFYASQFKPRTVSEMLRQVRGRMVVSIRLQRASITTEQIELSIENTVADVVAAGAQDWVIIEVPALLDDDSRAPINTWVPIITSAGITAAVNASAENLMASPFTPAEIVASGATWVTVVGPGRSDGVTNARITDLVAAGLQVTVVTNARQYWTTNAFSLGARSVSSPDPVYARGTRGVAGDLAYRQTLIPGLETKTSVIGGLTPVTDQSTAMWNAGFARNDLDGRWFPLQYGWSGTSPVVRNAQLLGHLCPLPNATNYRLRLQVRRATDADPDNRTVGLFFAVPDDRGISHIGAVPNPGANGYIAAFNSRTSGTRMQLLSVTAGSQTALGSVTTGATAYPADTWITLTITVTPTNVSMTSSTNTAVISVANTAWRGAYAYYVWDDQLGPMVHGYDNPTDLLTYEALS
jgi:hypothetical protein